MELKERLKQVLEGNGGNYIFPFFWQRGEEESVLRDYMRAIREANIREVCVESRPHPDFAGPDWWRIWISFWKRRKNAGCGSGFWMTSISRRAMRPERY